MRLNRKENTTVPSVYKTNICEANQRQPSQTGQGMTEYIIIVALIAIGAVTAASFFGARVQSQFVSMGNEVSGVAGVTTGNIEAPTPEAVNLGTYGN